MAELFHSQATTFRFCVCGWVGVARDTQETRHLGFRHSTSKLHQAIFWKARCLQKGGQSLLCTGHPHTGAPGVRQVASRLGDLPGYREPWAPVCFKFPSCTQGAS